MSSKFRQTEQFVPGRCGTAAPNRDAGKSGSRATHLRLAYTNPAPVPRETDIILAVIRKLDSSAIDMRDIKVTAKGAEVTLHGTIRGKSESRRAISTAGSVLGVRLVHNELFGWV